MLTGLGVIYLSGNVVLFGVFIACMSLDGILVPYTYIQYWWKKTNAFGKCIELIIMLMISLSLIVYSLIYLMYLIGRLGLKKS